MKIDFISNSIAGGGAERVMVLLANGFIEKYSKISIITFNQGQSYELDNKLNLIKLYGGKLKNHTLRSTFNLLKFYYYKKNRPDVAISLMPKMNFISILVCKIFGIKVIACEHNNHLREVDIFTKFIWNFVYRYADQLTVLTSFDKPFFEKKSVKVTVMPNPCTFIPLEKPVELRSNVILAVGSLNRIEHKGFDNLIKLIKPVLKEFPTWKLKIVGDGKNGMNLLSNLAKEHDIEDQIIFTGFQKNVAQIMRNSEILILSSRWEGLPMVLLEGMSQGMACIAYNCKTGPSDIITNYENGLLIKDQDMKEMQNGLKNLMNNRVLRRKLGGNGIKSLENYSMDSIMFKWEQLFKKILKG